MSFYDRDYYRNDEEEDQESSVSIFSGMSVTFMLIMANILVYLANMFATPETSRLTYTLAMHDWTISHPIYWFEFITYGFAHDPSNFYHIFGNMLVLFFFGRWLERKYGKLEFFVFYMLAVLAGGLVWGITNGYPVLMGGPIRNIPMLGASGAVSAVVILFAWNYPSAQVFLFGILPMPAWVCGVMYVLADTFGMVSGGSHIAHSVHIAGAVFASIYFVSHLRFTGLKRLFKGRNRRVSSSSTSGWSFRSKPSETSSSATTYTWNTPASSPIGEGDLEAEVNRILRKIKATGEASLTEKEKETLMYASREYQKRSKGK